MHQDDYREDTPPIEEMTVAWTYEPTVNDQHVVRFFDRDTILEDYVPFWIDQMRRAGKRVPRDRKTLIREAIITFLTTQWAIPEWDPEFYDDKT